MVELVIKIDEDIAQRIINGKKEEPMNIVQAYSATIAYAIQEGVSLTKGHGRLIDESDLMPDSDYEDGIFYAVSIGAINGARTIVEADKEESEVEE